MLRRENTQLKIVLNFSILTTELTVGGSAVSFRKHLVVKFTVANLPVIQGF